MTSGCRAAAASLFPFESIGYAPDAHREFAHRTYTTTWYVRFQRFWKGFGDVMACFIE